MADIIGIILLTIGVLMLIEGVVVALFPKTAKKKLIYLARKEERIRNVALIETITAIILVIVGIALLN